MPNYLFQHKEAEIIELAAKEPTLNQYGYILNDKIVILGNYKSVFDNYDMDCDAILIIRNWRTPFTHQEMQIQLDYNKTLVIYRKSYKNPSYEEIGDNRLEDTLVGRVFRHGVYDCGSAIRSWYWQRAGIVIRDMPRDYGWWDKEYIGETQDLYSRFIDRSDWNELEQCVSMDALRKGDVFTYAPAVSVKWPNGGPEQHAGVYVGNGVVFHHVASGLSKFDSADPWLRRTGKVRWYRRKDIDDLSFLEIPPRKT